MRNRTRYIFAAALLFVSQFATAHGNYTGDRIANSETVDGGYDQYPANKVYASEPPSLPKRNYIKPVNGPFSRRGFGLQRDPFTGRSRMHRGQDILASFGSPVFAAKDGVVEVVSSACASWSRNRSQRRCGGGFGNFVRIRHADGNYTYYGHMAGANQCPALAGLRSGKRVSQGQKMRYLKMLWTAAMTQRPLGLPVEVPQCRRDIQVPSANFVFPSSLRGSCATSFDIPKAA